MSRPWVTVAGITPGNASHMILLALRATGEATTEQLNNRCAGVSNALSRLVKAGLIDKPDCHSVRLTDAGRALIDPDGPLSRRKTLINYCHL